MDWNPIRGELLAMAEEDLRVRAELAADGSLFQGYHPHMRAAHDRHVARLAQIMADYGWPGVPQVGPEGAEAAWLIVQHAIAQPALQRRALDALRAAAARGEVPALHPAMLEDRIRTFEGKPNGTARSLTGTRRANYARCRLRIRSASTSGDGLSGFAP